MRAAGQGQQMRAGRHALSHTSIIKREASERKSRVRRSFEVELCSLSETSLKLL